MKTELRLLFVCLGNICRSPAAEGIMKQLIEKHPIPHLDIVIDSAGTYGGHAGDLPDSRMRAHAAQRGYDLCSHSRKVCSSDFEEFDLILAMDDRNIADLERLTPCYLDTKERIHRMVEFCQRIEIDHVPDPYYSGSDGFEQVLDILEDACEGLYTHLKNRNR